MKTCENCRWGIELEDYEYLIYCEIDYLSYYKADEAPGGTTKWAHRVSYALFNGDIAEQMHIDHNCRNRKCVNPFHLEQMTPIENYRAIGRRRRRDEKRMQEEAGQLRLW